MNPVSIKSLLHLSIGLVCLFMCLIMGSFVFHLFDVQTVFVASSPEFFTDTTVLTEARNLLFISDGGLRSQIKARNSTIEDVSIKKHFPNALTIFITPKQPVAQIESAGKTILVDATGYTLPRGEQKAYSWLPTIHCPTEDIDKPSQLPKQTLAAITLSTAFIKQLPNQFWSFYCEEEIDTIRIESTDSTSKIFASTKHDVSYVASSLQVLLKQFRIDGSEPTTIDLRFDKPVITHAGSTIESSSSGSRP